jgi:hypothetical protein
MLVARGVRVGGGVPPPDFASDVPALASRTRADFVKAVRSRPVSFGLSELR